MSWTHYRDKEPTARKAHECVLCELPIAVGEQYLRRDGRQDGAPVSCPMHLRCEAITAYEEWGEDEWMFRDAADFREVMNAYRGRVLEGVEI